jgi:hypothetical protein
MPLLSLGLLGLLLGAPMELTATTLTVAQDGSWSADGEVVIHWRGRVFYAEQAAYRRGLGRVELNGKVHSAGLGAVLTCNTLEIAEHRVVASAAAVKLLDDGGRVLARVRAKKFIQTGSFREFSDVDFTLCACEPAPWSITARRIQVMPGRDRVDLSVPVFRLGNVPVLAMPWWSFPLSGRVSGLLFPVAAYDARDGTRLRQPVYLAPSRWWDATLEPGYVEGRGFGLGSELRLRPTPRTSSVLAGQLQLDDGIGRWMLRAEHGSFGRAHEWVHRGVWAGDPALAMHLSDDVYLRQRKVIDLFHRLRVGSDVLAWTMDGWQGMRNGLEVDPSELPVWRGGTALRLHRDLGGVGASLELGGVGTPDAPTAFLRSRLTGGMRWLPYLGVQYTGRTEWLGSEGAWRAGARLRVHTRLMNSRKTVLEPAIDLRVQRVGVGALAEQLSPSWWSRSGQVLRVGLRATELGFVHSYDLMAAERSGFGEEAGLTGLLFDWNGRWDRKRWRVDGRWMIDSLDPLRPAHAGVRMTFRDRKQRDRLRVGYQRSHVARDLTIDEDPWLGFSRTYSTLPVSSDLFEDIHLMVKLDGERWQASSYLSARPDLGRVKVNSVSVTGGYTSACRCWAAAATVGYAGDIVAVSAGYGAPIFSLSISAGQNLSHSQALARRVIDRGQTRVP